MKIGDYQVGRYHAIIKKVYEDGSVDYETSFSDRNDFYESMSALLYCRNKKVGLGSDNPQVLKKVIAIRGKEKIIRELGNQTRASQEG